MKCIMINDIVYSVGDEIFRVCNGFDISRLNINNKTMVNKCTIEKITDAGYIYVKDVIPHSTVYGPHSTVYGEYYHTERINKQGFGKGCYIIPYDSQLDDKLTQIYNASTYIQNTFVRLKKVKSLSYDKAQKINALLDEIGIDKVEE